MLLGRNEGSIIIPTVSLESELSKLCPVDAVKISVDKLTLQNREALRYLGYKYGRKQKEISYLACYIGRKIIWKLSGGCVSALESVFVYAYENDQDSEWINCASFDLGTSKFVRFFGEIAQKDHSQLWALSDKLRLPFYVIFNLSLMMAFLMEPKIRVSDYNKMGSTVQRFRKWLEIKESYARYNLDFIDSTKEDKICDNERISLESIFNG